MESIAPPVGRGWEFLTGTGWDWDQEIAEIPVLLAEKMKAPSVEACRIVFAATTLANRSVSAASTLKPIGPPQSWATSVMSRRSRPIDQAAHPLDVAGERVVGGPHRLVGAAEADVVGRDHPDSAVDEDRDDRAVEVGPGRLPVQQQRDRSVRRTFVDVVHPQRVDAVGGDLGVVRLERVARQIREALVRRPHDLRHAWRSISATRNASSSDCTRLRRGSTTDS